MTSILLRRFRHTAKAVFSLGLAASLAFAAQPETASAQQRKMKIIRDAEIEALLMDYARPIFRAAGIGSSGAQIVIIDDRDFNAFVASGRRMYINSGALLEAETPNEIIGVIAHETGHLAGGHLQNLRNEMARAQAIGAIASILSAGAMVAGAAAGSSAVGRGGAAAMTAGPGMAMRSVLSYRRAQEISADRAALTYLNATHQSAKGMIKTFRRFADQSLFSAQYVDPYVQSHPMPAERIAQLETIAAKSQYWDAKDPPSLQLRHDMMRAKLSGYTESPARVEQRFPRSQKTLPSAYAHAILAYRTGGVRNALGQIDALIRSDPKNPYFYELKGQALLESGKADAAVAPLRQAYSLVPDAGLIRILLGHAILETGRDNLLGEAIGHLRAGVTSEPLSSLGYRYLAMAYARQGHIPQAELATANGLLIDGDVRTAQSYAKRVQAKVKRGSPEWLQADDILTYKPPDTQR
ncbi:M48 family metalloprotease [Afifella sp. JA880]|uniref:M48 family metalloprotease n=1 Tax=Afifella sp. JA880 TaxID=2975280 RepID=UPI0021BB8B9D|nr:M48 family metalloprotease [Afifella sp. JA880]MCT8266915.1 M48 family metalloprotease [Afifella sp. JA880]